MNSNSEIVHSGAAVMPGPGELHAAGPPAPFAARAVAWLVDVLAVALLCGALLAWLAVSGKAMAHGEPLNVLVVSAILAVVAVMLPPLVALAYLTICHACGGQTVGKLLLRLRVIAVDGQPLSWGSSFLRCAGQLLSAMPLAAGYLWALVDLRRQAWHDHLAATRVVLVEKSLDKEPAIQ